METKMSSGQKACTDDEEDWDIFRRRVGLFNVPWGVYSREAAAIKELHKKLQSTGLLLKVDVLQYIAQEDLRIIHAKERQSFVDAEALMKKYT